MANFGRFVLIGCGGLVVLVVALVVVVAAVGGGGGSQTTGSGSGGVAEDRPGATKANAVAIGEPVKAGKVEWTVVTAREASSLKSSFGGGKKDGNFVIVDFNFTNGNQEAVTLDSESFRLIDSEGREFEVDTDTLILGWETKTNPKPLPAQGAATPLFVERGSRTMADAISAYIRSVSHQISKDDLHELQVTCEVARKQNYPGPMMCFLGATEIEKGTRTIAEFDGVLLFPASDPNRKFAVIVEAKNQRNAHTAARKQLNKRLQELCPDYMDYEVEDVYKKGAYATLRLHDSTPLPLPSGPV